MNDEELIDALAGWLEPVMGGRPSLLLEGKPGSGYSAENLIFTASLGGDTRRMVLRRDTAAEPIYPPQAPGLTTGIIMQHLVMSALSKAVPIAEVLGLETDPAVLGVPFFVMGHISGEVPIEAPPYTQVGFFVDATPARRNAMVDEGLKVLARVHEVDWSTSGLEAFDPPGTAIGPRRQLQIWGDSIRSGLAGRTSPVLDASLEWLYANVPTDTPADEIVLSWGDARLGNMIWDGDRCVCVTDFEGAALGPRELDVGWWLMFDRWMHEISDVERLEGEPTRAEQRAIYERHAGVTLGDTEWYEVFGALRFANTAVQVMNRYVAAGHLPADQTLWRDNPATEVLASLMEEVTS
jgi:aminoglycoside phosphotransferase (APT) family kinase protein